MIAAAILRWARAKKPDFVIGGPERPYLRRHWLLPRNPVFNVYVHQFLRSDDDRALHDHPWLFNCSILLQGGYFEHTPRGIFARMPGSWYFRFGGAPHRVELPINRGEPVPCWTVFITGPRVRHWGFYCPQGWVHWKRFTAADDKGAIGQGCDS